MKKICPKMSFSVVYISVATRNEVIDVKDEIDEAIVNGLKSGSEEAFNEIYTAYEKMLYFLALSIVGDEYAAKDIVQEVFVQIFIKVRTIKQNCNFHFWINKITKNIAYNYLKKNKNRKELREEDIERISIKHFTRDFDFNLQYLLTKKDNLLLIYHLCYGLGFREMGHVLGMSYETVIKRYYRALNRMRRMYLDREEQKKNERI